MHIVHFFTEPTRTQKYIFPILVEPSFCHRNRRHYMMVHTNKSKPNEDNLCPLCCIKEDPIMVEARIIDYEKDWLLWDDLVRPNIPIAILIESPVMTHMDRGLDDDEVPFSRKDTTAASNCPMAEARVIGDEKDWLFWDDLDQLNIPIAILVEPPVMAHMDRNMDDEEAPFTSGHTTALGAICSRGAGVLRTEISSMLSFRKSCPRGLLTSSRKERSRDYQRPHLGGDTAEKPRVQALPLAGPAVGPVDRDIPCVDGGRTLAASCLSLCWACSTTRKRIPRHRGGPLASGSVPASASASLTTTTASLSSSSSSSGAAAHGAIVRECHTESTHLFVRAVDDMDQARPHTSKVCVVNRTPRTIQK